MINAGYGVELNEARAVDSAAYDAPDVAVQSGNDQAGDQHDYAQPTACDMGNHIEQFLTLGVVGKNAVPKFCSFDRDAPPFFIR